MKKLIVIFKLFLLLTEIYGIKKIWNGSMTFNYIKSWENGVPPSNNCTSQSIKFPSKLFTNVQLKDDMNVNQIILSEDGGLLFGSDMAIILSDSTENAQKCSEKEKEVILKRPEPNQWYSIDSWIPVFEGGDQKFNKATPDTQFIPCSNDIVVFPMDSTILVDVNFAPYLNFHEIQIHGRSYKDEFQDLLRTEMGSSMFINAYSTTVNAGKCPEQQNCVCDHQNFVCETVNCIKKEAFCMNPILPEGFCCEICGGFITFNVKNDFNMKQFLKSVDQTLSFSKTVDKDSIEYYANFVSKNSVQLVIVDKEIGDDVSGDAINYLKKNLIDKIFADSVTLFGASGKSFTPNSGTSIFFLIFLSLICVATFLGAFYVYHYENNPIPRLVSMIRTRQLQPSQFIFARFDNQRHGDEGTVDVVVQEEEIEENPSSFNNPLYEDKLNLNEVKDDECSTSGEATELKEAEKIKEIPKIEVTKFDEVDLLGPSEE